ncbi:hypothetical protein RD110_17425 [Rhodoferax koreense]|uniref:Endoproteinase ArgC n=1 Tax=Rhodoferax koreensis TaxID=1842727 RepID=A0A1P8K451_9BURK|nr:trypsin-like peptidase domain-containing protein [Rhodoferax koreense]APW40767.1 hypothetical protein RD110_17425 [Rhodoferax koreense]
MQIWLLGSVAALVLSACGGGSGGGSSDTSASGGSTGGATGGSTGGSCVAASTQVPSAVDRVEARARSLTLASSGDVSPMKAREVQSPRARLVALAEVAPAKLAAETTSSGLRGAPRKIGFARSLPDTTLDWQTLADGRRAASISISSPSAQGLRLGLLVRSLPADATVRVYAQSASTGFELPASEILQALKANAAGGASGDTANTYWLPAVLGAEATVEVSLPAGADTAKVDVAVPQLSHLFALPDGTDAAGDTAGAGITAKIGEAGSCEIDAACNTDYQAESNAVARIVFVQGGSAFQCTGTLLNDNLNSGTPYLITANHCISTQASASSLQSYWFYRAPSCGAGTLNPAATLRTGGATLLYASASTDTSFMRLNEAPPSGAVFAGWSVSAPALAATVGTLHHPEGDLLKLSTGTVKSYQNCSLSSGGTSLTCTGTAQSNSGFLDALLTSGSTEEGSSGAALFQTIGTSRYVIGQLYGGSSSCSLRSGSNIYGRFDAAYNAALKQWLAATTVPTC